MRMFRDIETNEIVSEDDLRAEFEALKAEYPDEYNYTFGQYIRVCTGKNGTLEEVNGGK